MKIIVLHGEDTEKSYGRLRKFIETARGRSWEITYLDESTQKLQDDLSAGSLFTAERFFILRDIKKIGKNQLDWLNKKTDLQGNLVIYHEGSIPVGVIKNLPKDAKIEEFKLPKTLWNFLDNIYPGHGEKSVIEFHKIIKTEPPELVLSLVSKLFRELYWVKSSSDTLPYPSWRSEKIKKHADKFSAEQLKHLINVLSGIDIAVKTSKAEIVSSLDLLMLKHLK